MLLHVFEKLYWFLLQLFGFRKKPSMSYIKENHLESDSDYEEDNEEVENERQENSKNNDIYEQDDLRLDAIGSIKSPGISIKELEDVELIERHIDKFDKISLIFLLYDNPMFALQDMRLIQEGSKKKVILEWCTHQSKINYKWYEELKEALCIIQHYLLLSKLGISKKDSIERFLPNRETSLFINLIRKKLYRLFENLCKDEVRVLIESLKCDFESKIPNVHFRDFDGQLEMLFCNLLDHKYITLGNLNNLNKILKKMNKTEFYLLLSEHEKAPIVNESVGNTARDLHLDRNISISSHRDLGSYLSIHEDCDTSFYDIDPEKPAYCLIIDQQSFYQDMSDEKEHLVQKDLEERTGTVQDVLKLRETYSRFNFTIDVVENLTDDQILDEIQKAVKKAQTYSSFIVCILSHGREGEVFGVNSVPVQIKLIKQIICKGFKNKPKILLLQMCQGKNLIRVDNTDDNLQMDGPSDIEYPNINYGDLLVFNATVPGFAAVRDKSKGTWFIQTFCDVLSNSNEKDDFNRLCTKIIHRVRQKKWKNGHMIPEVNSTFSKLLVFPKRNYEY